MQGEGMKAEEQTENFKSILKRRGKEGIKIPQVLQDQYCSKTQTINIQLFTGNYYELSTFLSIHSGNEEFYSSVTPSDHPVSNK